MSTFSPVVNAPNLYVDGLVYHVPTTTTIAVTGGACRSSDNSEDIIISADVTTIDATKNGVNGLDTGSLAANTVYALYALGDTSNLEIPAFVLSANQLNAPYVPGHYDVLRRIGWFMTDGSSLLRSISVAGSGSVRRVEFETPFSLGSAVTGTSFAAVALHNFFPNKVLPIDMLVTFTNSGYTPGGAGNKVAFRSTGQTVAIGSAYSVISTTALAVDFDVQMNTGLDNSALCSIDAGVIVSVDGTPSAALKARGFVDYL